MLHMGKEWTIARRTTARRTHRLLTTAVCLKMRMVETLAYCSVLMREDSTHNVSFYKTFSGYFDVSEKMCKFSHTLYSLCEMYLVFGCKCKTLTKIKLLPVTTGNNLLWMMQTFFQIHKWYAFWVQFQSRILWSCLFCFCSLGQTNCYR